MLVYDGIKGQLQDQEGAPVIYANTALYSAADSSLIKVESSNEAGIFEMQGIKPGSYYMVATYVGMPDLVKKDLQTMLFKATRKMQW